MDESGAIDELATGNFRTSNTKIVDTNAIPKDVRQTHNLWGYKPEERPVLASSVRQRDAQKHRVKGLFCLTCRAVNEVAVAHPNGVFTLQCGHTRATKVAIMRYQTGYQVGYANECSDAETSFLGSISFAASSHKTSQSSCPFVSFMVPPGMDGKPRAPS